MGMQLVVHGREIVKVRGRGNHVMYYELDDGGVVYRIQQETTNEWLLMHYWPDNQPGHQLSWIGTFRSYKATIANLELRVNPQ